MTITSLKYFDDLRDVRYFFTFFGIRNVWSFYSLEKISFTAPISALGSSVMAKNAVNRLNWGVLYGVNHSTKSSELEILPNKVPSLNFLNSGHEYVSQRKKNNNNARNAPKAFIQFRFRIGRSFFIVSATMASPPSNLFEYYKIPKCILYIHYINNIHCSI